MPAAWPFADFEINVAKSGSFCDGVPFFEAGRLQDMEVLVDVATSWNSDSRIPVLDRNGSVLALQIDDAVGVTVEECNFAGLNRFMIGQSGGKVKMEDEDGPQGSRLYILYETKQSSGQRQ